MVRCSNQSKLSVADKARLALLHDTGGDAHAESGLIASQSVPIMVTGY
jgi:hypothetical protein